MDIEPFEKLRTFIIKTLNLNDSDETTYLLKKDEDFGIIVSDTIKFIKAYSKEFNVDVSAFVEAYPKTPVLFIRFLEKGIIDGKLDDEIIKKSANPFTEDNYTRKIRRLPESIREKAIRSGNEFGWKQEDFIEVIKEAKRVPMAILGGQIRYALPDGTCEHYWLSYDPEGRKRGELWITYCSRSANECIVKFEKLIANTTIEKEAEEFPFLKEKLEQEVNIGQYRLFMLVFSDDESDEHQYKQ